MRPKLTDVTAVRPGSAGIGGGLAIHVARGRANVLGVDFDDEPVLSAERARVRTVAEGQSRDTACIGRGLTAECRGYPNQLSIDFRGCPESDVAGAYAARVRAGCIRL